MEYALASLFSAGMLCQTPLSIDPSFLPDRVARDQGIRLGLHAPSATKDSLPLHFVAPGTCHVKAKLLA